MVTMSMNKTRKMVVFDLDETLGQFVEIGMFWDALKYILGMKEDDENEFFKVMDIFPEFLRPKIIEILEHLANMKKRKLCDSVMLYTNNQGPKSWAKLLTGYFDKKINYKLFDHIIAAFKVRGKIVELCRTSHDKKYDDLIRCARVPPDTQICFLDDQHHPLMENDNVYYINVKPFSYSLPYSVMAERYYNNNNINMKKETFISGIKKYMNQYNYKVVNKSDDEKAVDVVISKQILLHLNQFFDKKMVKTHRKTIKKYRYKKNTRNTRKR